MTASKPCGPCKKCSGPKKTKKDSEKKEGPKMGAHMDPTRAWWSHERYIRRRTSWMWRLRPYAQSKSELCDSCTHKASCHRIPLNERLTAKILDGVECPDYKSMWKRILGDDTEHDWGF